MKQLSSLDAQFLAIEDGRRTGHVAALAIHDPSTAPNGTLTCATMMDLLNERMHCCRHCDGGWPRCRSGWTTRTGSTTTTST